MAIHKDSIRYQMLEQIFNEEALAVRHMRLSVYDRCAKLNIRYNSGSITNALGSLLKDGYIATIRIDDDTYYMITDDGIDFLACNDEYYNKHRDRSFIRTIRKQDGTSVNIRLGAERRIVDNDAHILLRSFMAGAGLPVYRKQKPSFEELVCKITGSILPEELPDGYADINSVSVGELLEAGIYYTAREARDGFIRLGVHTDTFVSSNFRGLILRDGFIQVCYHMEGNFIQFRKDTEEELKVNLARLFGYDYSRVECLATGKSYSGACAIAMCAKHGRLGRQRARQEMLDSMTAPEQREYLEKESLRSSHVAAPGSNPHLLNARTDVYGRIYYAPATVPGIPLLKDILYVSVGSLPSDERKYFGSHADRYSINLDRWPIGRTRSTGNCSVYIPVLELKNLYRLKNRVSGADGEAVDVITDPKLADSISHILGTHAGEFRNINDDSQIEKVAAYDDFGFPAGDDRFEKIAQARRAKSEEKRLRGMEKYDGSISFAVTRTAAQEFKELMSDSGLARSETGRAVLEFALRNRADFLEFIRQRGAESRSPQHPQVEIPDHADEDNEVSTHADTSGEQGTHADTADVQQGYADGDFNIQSHADNDFAAEDLSAWERPSESHMDSGDIET
ncbi:MAG: hypothetical protein HUJ76_09205, partial [Parasporobacterium sp.]|nr:hypothetical protein [Parasporobacterium sp.]